MHIQQKFQQKDPHFFGIVVKINPSGYIETTDYFRLTRSGLKAVKKCVSTSRQAPDSNHPSCLGKDLYESIPLNVVDLKDPSFIIHHSDQFHTIGFNVKHRKRNVSMKENVLAKKSKTTKKYEKTLLCM